MKIMIEESGMHFGEYDEENVFPIEKSPIYSKKLQDNGAKVCEFVLQRGNRTFFVEAKTSCPNADNAQDTSEKLEKYNEYIESILLKMRHSLSIYGSLLLKRLNDSSLPEPLSHSDLSGKEIILLLVVKNADAEWLIPIQDDLRRRFYTEMRIWNIRDFLVINEDRARDRKFIR